MDHTVRAGSRSRRAAGGARAHGHRVQQNELPSVSGSMGGRFAHCMTGDRLRAARLSPTTLSQTLPSRNNSVSLSQIKAARIGRTIVVGMPRDRNDYPVPVFPDLVVHLSIRFNSATPEPARAKKTGCGASAT